MYWLRLAAYILLSIPVLLGAGTPELPPGSRIALRCDGMNLLIVGDLPDRDRLDAVEKVGFDRFPTLELHHPLSPAERVFSITPDVFRSLMRAPIAGFQIGAHWQIYPGSGRPASIEIEKLVLLLHGNGNQYAGAIGRIIDSNDRNRIGGLAAAEYLAVPGTVRPRISQTPMILLDSPDETAMLVLLRRAHETVHDDSWELADAVNTPEEEKLFRRMNQRFIATANPSSDVRMWRWTPPGRKPLLFVEAVWFDDPKSALFAADAVVQADDPSKIVHFSTQKAIWMRMHEFIDRDWTPYKKGAFLNAWQIGSDYFVLTYISGYEGSSVDLQRIDSVEGLVSVLGFGT